MAVSTMAMAAPALTEAEEFVLAGHQDLGFRAPLKGAVGIQNIIRVI